MNDIRSMPERIQAQAIGQSASQATEIERSRAIAEVQGALIVAQQRPRDQVQALERVREATKQLALAQRAFFKFPRGGQTVSGESIHLAVELARCWGNIMYGIVELSRGGAESEMMAYAWDLETNTRSQMGFIVPHRRDTKSGPTTLVDMRDIYENNANMGARRLRECIFRVLPAHVIELGKDTCLDTLQKGESDQPLTVRLASLVEVAEKMGISKARVEAKLGPVAALTAVDAANLHVSLRSVKRGEVGAEEEFPRVGTEEATARARRLTDRPAAEPRPDTTTPDNPAAAEGRPDEERGEAHNGAEDEHPARVVADRIVARAGEVANMPDLNSLRANERANVEAMPDDMRGAVEAAYAAAEKRIRAASSRPAGDS